MQTCMRRGRQSCLFRVLHLQETLLEIKGPTAITLHLPAFPHPIIRSHSGVMTSAPPGSSGVPKSCLLDATAAPSPHVFSERSACLFSKL